MEKNVITNKAIKEDVAKYAIKYLTSNKMISQEEMQNIKVNFGYIFAKEDGVLEGLFKIITNQQNVYYFALQNNSLSLLKMNEDMYNNTINTMKGLHPCLNVINSEETVDQKLRREKNNAFLKSLNITTSESLLCIHSEETTNLKSEDEIIKRAIACLIVIQIACDINNGEYENSKAYFLPILKEFQVEDCLNEKEKRIIDGTFSRQDAIDMDWAYEAYWALCWCLGLVDDISDASKLCDCRAAIDFVMKAYSFDEVKQKCHLRSKKEILDLEDLYFRMHWAVNEAKVNPNASSGRINASNVLERRRALEWVLSDEKDWYKVNLNA